MIKFCQLSALICLVVTACSNPVVRVTEGLIDTADSLSCGLPRMEGVEVIPVFRSDGYVNNVLLAHFHGRYYCMWQQSEHDEDTPDTGVWLARSTDGYLWTEPTLLAAPDTETFASPGGCCRRNRL